MYYELNSYRVCYVPVLIQVFVRIYCWLGH